MRIIPLLCVLCALTAFASTAAAQMDPSEPTPDTNGDDAFLEGSEGAKPGPQAEPKAEQETLEGEEEAKYDADEAFLTNTEVAEIEAPETEKGTGIEEDPETPYFSVGARLRWLMIPEWLIGAFNVDTQRAREADSPWPLISNVGVGPEFTYRKDGFDITVAIWWANLGFKDPISFKEGGTSGQSWEVIDNNLHAILVTGIFRGVPRSPTGSR